MRGRGYCRASLGLVVVSVLSASVATAQNPPAESRPVDKPETVEAESRPSPTEPRADTVLAPPSPPLEVSSDPVAASPRSAAGALSRRHRQMLAALDALLPEALADLDVAADYIAPAVTGELDDSALLARARQGWVVAAQLIERGGVFVLRLTVAQPHSRTLSVRAEAVTPRTLEVRALSMMRELTRVGPSQGELTPSTIPAQARNGAVSPGRAVLAVTGALTGAFVGVAVEELGGSEEAALVYPLMSLGAGVGVGASLVIAEEWNINVPEAWTLTASVLWPTTAALLVADTRGLKHDSDRYLFGLAGTSLGLALGTSLVSFSDVSHGDAILLHSGAFFGALYGSLGQGLWTAKIHQPQSLGVGVGMVAGLVTGGLLGAQSELPGSDVLLLDLGLTLGAFGGAALASPWLLGADVTPTERRYWQGATLAGSIGGGVLAYLLLPDAPGQAVVSPYMGEVYFAQPELPSGWVVGVRSVF